jgi:predicted nucleic acid-binding protein
MVLLDTNLVSEVIKTAPNARVALWLTSQPRDDLFLCAVTEAELRFGVAMLPIGRRREGLAKLIEDILSQDFAGRILPFDSRAAIEYATVSATRHQARRPISIADAQIAAFARARGAAIATRNLRDFEGCGVDVINPWDEPA